MGNGGNTRFLKLTAALKRVLCAERHALQRKFGICGYYSSSVADCRRGHEHSVPEYQRLTVTRDNRKLPLKA
jgi:hypothetical protein